VNRSRASSRRSSRAAFGTIGAGSASRERRHFGRLVGGRRCQGTSPLNRGVNSLVNR
jgi:hypothetical protein